MIRGVGTALKVLSIVLTVGLALVVTSRFIRDVVSSHSRGRLASGLVKTQLEEMATLQPESEKLLHQVLRSRVKSHPPHAARTPDARDVTMHAVSFWLATSLAGGRDPGKIASEMHKWPAQHYFRHPSVLDRWTRTLRNWSEREQEVGSADLLNEGRVTYHRVIGYRRIGREADSVPLAFFAIHLLNEFMNRNPLSAQVPEALFMTGDLMLGLKASLPDDFRVHRILHLCEELYPETIWASEAEQRWRREVSQNAI